jgi:acyl-CoA reductase-like NAD-dependent aldehyde dehydrogenase
MSTAEILAELPKLSVGERDEVRRRLAELDDDNADAVALARAEELAGGAVPPRTQAEVFRSARAALP